VIGILLANTGSPAAPTPPALRSFLAQFLGDRRIVDLPPWLWRPILHGIILNTRPSRSARLYHRIWTPQGSPLIVISQRIAAGVQAALASQLEFPFGVVLGMRYGEPSISSALQVLRKQGATHLLVLPLFPQYSSATTASVLDVVIPEAGLWQPPPAQRVVESYFHQPAYLQALQTSIQDDWASFGRPQRLLFSFHGIPESYRRRGDPYAEHCQHTAIEVARGLGLPAAEWGMAYQSRFGPARWLQPYTVDTLKTWGEEGLSSLGVICPGFAADCLETLEEIGHEGRSIFQHAGGGEYRYIPALNDQPEHIQALFTIISTELRAWMDESNRASFHSTSP
jgi:protoporphyrin/coproporphyrin ferrochelatase